MESLESRRQLSADAGLFHSTGTLSQAREAFATATVGTQALFIGGEYYDANRKKIYSDVVDIYDAASGRWSTARLLQPSPYTRAVTAGSKVLIEGENSGGGGQGSSVQIYDSVTGQWSVARLPSPSDTPVTAAGTKALFVRRDFVDIFDATKGQFSTVVLPHAGAYVAAVFGNVVLFAGPGNTVDVYDATSGQWSTKTFLGPGGPGQEFTLATKAVFLRGHVEDVYDSATRQWSSISIETPHFMGRQVILGDKIVSAGTFYYGVEQLDVLDTTTGHFSTTKLAHGYVPAAAVVGTKALFAGGDDDDGLHASDAVDIYDASTGQLSTQHLSSGREAMAAATVGSKVIFAGGYNARGNVADIYDDATGQWTTAQLSQERTNMDSVVVDGQALFAGGYSYIGQDPVPATVEIFSSSSIAEPDNPNPPVDSGFKSGPSVFSWANSSGATK